MFLPRTKNIFWWGVEMLLILMKHYRPNIANVTRELRKVNNGAHPAAFCKLPEEMRYVLDTKNLGLRLEPSSDASKPWEIVCSSDGHYAGDLVIKKRISGFILYALDWCLGDQQHSTACCCQVQKLSG